MNIHWKDWCWNWSSNTLATWCKDLTHWKIPWCLERLKAGGEGGNRGWDCWVASLTQWTLVWAISKRPWWTGKPRVLQFTELQRTGLFRDWLGLTDQGFLDGSDGEVPVCNAGDLGPIPGEGRTPWRRKWQPTPVVLPGKSHGQRSLVGYSPWGCKELDTAKWPFSFFL